MARTIARRLFPVCIAFVLFTVGCNSGPAPRPAGKGLGGIYDVRAFGAAGDGATLDTNAVNSAIDAAEADGGGTVHFPAGVYLCHSIHLKSNVALYLDQGSTLMAAPPAPKGSDALTYDVPEPNPSDHYQDFGHTHWHNSFIWGVNLRNIAIMGPGMIDGSKGLVRGGVDPKKKEDPKVGAGMGAGDKPTTEPTSKPTSKPTTKGARKPREPRKPKPEFEYPTERDSVRPGLANKAIALKLCTNVILKDFSIRAGGHFGILATGVDNFTLDGLKIDTNRDGMDLDCCTNTRVANCTVNSPFDDGICPKSSYALGYNKSTDNMTITNCQVSGYVAGSLLDGTCKPFWGKNAKSPGGTGRIKCGTESNGGFRNLSITNCVFDYCRGFALESVDGALLEDVTVSNLSMRHIANSPIFMRLGARLRGPKQTTQVGTLQRVNIDNVVVYDADPNFASIISGIPDHDIKNVKISNVQVFTRKADAEKTKKYATTQSLEFVRKYPEPGMFGPTGSYGFFVRHVSGIEFNNVSVHNGGDDYRPAFLLTDVTGAKLVDVDTDHDASVAPFILRNAKDVYVHQCAGVDDTRLDSIDNGKLGSGGIPTLDKKKPEPRDDQTDEDYQAQIKRLEKGSDPATIPADDDQE
ncbi:MAG TPA: glycosyl hydrolase family 28-related protein [Tepidisphaeraceae bacterium]|nr:glycosyl hydrolase family 28-related protein [Tepidisphaeraceae bacterium]